MRPIDVSAAIFTPVWKYQPGESDLTVMRLIISGEEDGKPATYTYDMYDEYDAVTGFPSMARTTGYTCAGVRVSRHVVTAISAAIFACR